MFAASEILVGETSIPQNLTLFRDFIKKAVEQFTAQKTMDVVYDALGLDPQREESVRPMTVMEPPQDMVVEQDVVAIMEEERAKEEGAQKMSLEGDNSRSPLSTPTNRALLPSQGWKGMIVRVQVVW